MRHNQLDRELKLMLLMTENREYTVEQLCEKLKISRRSLYYYFEFFRDNGFIIEKNGTKYSLDKDSPFFKKLFKVLHFTEDEAITMRRLLDMVNDNSVHVQHIRQKLNRLYDMDILDDIVMREQVAANISTLYDAIKYRQKAILHNYSSPHSNTLSSRVVEPFMFLNGNNEIRCYELTSGMNKTFKLSRMESVILLSENWEHSDKHKQVYTDVFMFSGEEWHPVRIRMNRLAYNLLIEEYPQAFAHISQDEDKEHWTLQLDVCNYLGISRFVLGLYDCIEVLGNDDFIAYIKNKVEEMKKSFDNQ